MYNNRSVDKKWGECNLNALIEISLIKNKTISAMALNIKTVRSASTIDLRMVLNCVQIEYVTWKKQHTSLKR